jgi:hypothetical protein
MVRMLGRLGSSAALTFLAMASGSAACAAATKDRSIERAANAASLRELILEFLRPTLQLSNLIFALRLCWFSLVAI